MNSATILRPSQAGNDTQLTHAGADTSREGANKSTTPIKSTLLPYFLPDDEASQVTSPKADAPVVGDHSAGGEATVLTAPNPVTPASSNLLPSTEDTTCTTPIPVAPGAGNSTDWIRVRKWAETFDDAQKYRIATGNRLGFNSSGGVTKNAPKIEPAIFSPFYGQIMNNEATAKRALLLTYREVVPEEIREFQKSTPGLGAHTMALLLGRVGNPRVAIPHYWETDKTKLAELEHVCDARCKPGSNRHLVTGEPHARSVSQLLQYCGFGAPKMYEKGNQEIQLWNGSPMAKKLVFTIVDCAIKEGGRSVTALLDGEQSPEDAVRPHRRLYEEIRLAQVGQEHSVECVRCGPSGSPALPGSPWSLAHAHAAAMRKVGKQFLKDLWNVAPAN